MKSTGDVAPLDGCCVVEIGHSIAGPYAAHILGELGAEVVKVEDRQTGDYARGWGPPFWEGRSAHFLSINRGKKSIQLRLSDPADRRLLEELIVRRADAVIWNLRPGKSSQYGLGPRALLEKKPALIVCDIGAFGCGPLENRPGYDPLMQAFSGLMSITGEEGDRPPIRVGAAIVDLGAGMWAALGILAGLYRRCFSGRGGLVETSLYETALSYMQIPLASYMMNPRSLKPYGSGVEGIVPYQAFKTSTDWLIIGAGNDGLFCKLVHALGLPELAGDPRFAKNADRVVHRGELIEILQRKITHYSSDELALLLEKHGIPNSPVMRVEQVVRHPQTEALGIIQKPSAEGPSTLGLPLRFDGSRPSVRPVAPMPGQHSDEILSLV